MYSLICICFMIVSEIKNKQANKQANKQPCFLLYISNRVELINVLELQNQK